MKSMLMVGFTSARVDTLLSALRKNGAGRINYKAVLTETNKSWDSVHLFQEIKREHDILQADRRKQKRRRKLKNEKGRENYEVQNNGENRGPGISAGIWEPCVCL